MDVARYMLVLCIVIMECRSKGVYKDYEDDDELLRSIEELGKEVEDLENVLATKKRTLAAATSVAEDLDVNKEKKEDTNDANDLYFQRATNKRIVAGIKARKGGFPWQVGIYLQGQLICGGTLISDRYVMSAAHCFGTLKADQSNLNQFEVHLGEYDRNAFEGDAQIRRISFIKLHEDYQKGDIHANDIAVMRLDRDVSYSMRTFPGCIPVTNDPLNAGDDCVLTGWGREYAWGETEAILKELSTPIVGHEECRQQNERNGFKVLPSMLCTGSKYSYAGGCMGDSGGPLSCIQKGTRKWKVYGIVSWGSVQCNGLDRFTVYTKVRSYLDWIKEHTGVVPGENCFRDDP